MTNFHRIAIAVSICLASVSCSNADSPKTMAELREAYGAAEDPASKASSSKANSVEGIPADHVREELGVEGDIFIPPSKWSPSDLPEDVIAAKRYKAGGQAYANSQKWHTVGQGSHGYAYFDFECESSLIDNIRWHINCWDDRGRDINLEETAKELPLVMNIDTFNPGWRCTSNVCLDETGKLVGAVQEQWAGVQALYCWNVEGTGEIDCDFDQEL
ncbi:hypothetical protein ACSBPQ_11540 [Stenotrophomonas sp. JC08]|uniref:hypothetical protein n=1 Tax=Stenotrophomonas sp. JC08 TaxID=3445779 RepID=UPI003FA2A514